MSYVAVVFIVGLLIAIHEYGHLLAAKLCGIPVRQFSLGFGPRLLEVKRGETSYRLSWIPIGGYVLPAIELDDFRALAAYKRITFALGGPVANVIAAFMGLFVLGLTQSNLPVLGATSFAATKLWTGLQQQVAGLSRVGDGCRSTQRDRRYRGCWRHAVRLHVHEPVDVLGAHQYQPGGDEPVAAASARRRAHSLLRAREDLSARGQDRDSRDPGRLGAGPGIDGLSDGSGCG